MLGLKRLFSAIDIVFLLCGQQMPFVIVVMGRSLVAF